MSGVVFQVPPLNRRQIRNVARKVRAINRELTGQDASFFPIVEFLDVRLPQHFDDFTLEILEAAEMGNTHGLTYPDCHLIQIREDIYERASRHEGRDRMTLAHELGHYILHPGLGLARQMAKAENIDRFRNSEWQASAFGGELLVSADHIHKCSCPEEAKMSLAISMSAGGITTKTWRGKLIVLSRPFRRNGSLRGRFRYR